MRHRLTTKLGFLNRCLALWIFLALVIFDGSSPFFTPGSVCAADLNILSLSVRTRVSDKTTLGDPQPEEFQEVDLAAHLQLPWTLYDPSGWNVGTQMMASAGIIRGAGENGLVVSLVPEFVIGSDDGRFTLDFGVGFALFSRYRFGTQDYGGPFQFALTAGAGMPLYKRLGIGYRFLHYSDAAVNGPDTTGADFHMIELRYRF